MERRKIVKSGNTSYTLALPIDWIRKNKLNKGSLVNLSESELGDIIISAEDNKSTIVKDEIKTIKIEGKEPGEVYSELLRVYLQNYTTIILEGKNINKYPKLKQNIQDFIGLDIIENTGDSLVIKNFSSFDSEISAKSLIKKLDLSIRSMFDLLQTFFTSGISKEDYLELSKIEEQNKRLYFLTRKIILKFLDNPSLMKKYQTNYLQLSKDKVISMILKQLSFVLLLLGKTFLYLEHSKKDIKLLNEIFDIIIDEYRVVLSTMRYKKYEDTINFINAHDKDYNKWELYLKKTESPLIVESISYAIFIKDILDHLTYEIME